MWVSHNLLVSFDALSFHLPSEITKRWWNNCNTLYHWSNHLKIVNSNVFKVL